MQPTVEPEKEFPLSPEITRDYRIIRLLGKGGMGQVYLAEQLRVGNRRVALKVLAPHLSSDPAFASRFEKEASAGRINHPNVVTVYESRATQDGQIYIAMEFIDGETLEEVLEESGVLSLKRITEIVPQICSALSAAHKLGIVHRDIKPANIMVTETDRGECVKVLDFGIARMAESDFGGAQTQSGIIMGTADYMSPEQAEGFTGNSIDSRSDIYSLGMVVYQMLTGKVAFHGDTWMQTLQMHVTNPPLPPSDRRPDLAIPASIERAVLKALEKNRQDRQATVEQFAADLTSQNHESEGETLVDYVTNIDLQPKIDYGTKLIEPAKETEPIVDETPGRVLPVPATRTGAVVAPGRTASNKKVMAVAITVVAIAVVVFAGLWISHTPTPVPIPILTPTVVGPIDTIHYRVRLKKPEGSQETLDINNVVRSGQSIRLEFQTLIPGGIYLLYEDSDGSLKWVNYQPSGSPQSGTAGQWFDIPAGDWIGIDKRTQAEKFLLVFVPKQDDWTLSRLVSPKFNDKEGMADIRVDDAIKLRSFLQSNCLLLSSSGKQEGNTIVQTLATNAKADKIAYYVIEMNHS